MSSVTYEWNSLPNNGSGPSIRYNTGSIVYKDALYLICGAGAGSGRFSEVWSYNFKSSLWYIEPCKGDIPSAREGHSVSYINNGKVLIYGGQGHPYENQKSENLTDLLKVKTFAVREIYNDMYILDLNNFTWERVCFSGPLNPLGRKGHTATFIPPLISAYPALTALPISNILPKVPESRTSGMSSSSAISSRRGDHSGRSNDNKQSIYRKRSTTETNELDAENAVLSLENCIIIFGGSTIDPAKYSETVLNDAWAFSLTIYNWVKVPMQGQIPKPIYDHKAELIHGHFIAFVGGIICDNLAPHSVSTSTTTSSTTSANSNLLLFNTKKFKFKSIPLVTELKESINFQASGHSICRDLRHTNFTKAQQKDLKLNPHYGSLFILGGKMNISSDPYAIQPISVNSSVSQSVDICHFNIFKKNVNVTVIKTGCMNDPESRCGHVVVSALPLGINHPHPHHTPAALTLPPNHNLPLKTTVSLPVIAEVEGEKSTVLDVEMSKSVATENSNFIGVNVPPSFSVSLTLSSASKVYGRDDDSSSNSMSTSSMLPSLSDDKDRDSDLVSESFSVNTKPLKTNQSSSSVTQKQQQISSVKQSDDRSVTSNSGGGHTHPAVTAAHSSSHPAAAVPLSTVDQSPFNTSRNKIKKDILLYMFGGYKINTSGYCDPKIHELSLVTTKLGDSSKNTSVSSKKKVNMNLDSSLNHILNNTQSVNNTLFNTMNSTTSAISLQESSLAENSMSDSTWNNNNHHHNLSNDAVISLFRTNTADNWSNIKAALMKPLHDKTHEIPVNSPVSIGNKKKTMNFNMVNSTTATASNHRLPALDSSSLSMKSKGPLMLPSTIINTDPKKMKSLLSTGVSFTDGTKSLKSLNHSNNILINSIENDGNDSTSEIEGGTLEMILQEEKRQNDLKLKDSIRLLLGNGATFLQVKEKYYQEHVATGNK